MILRLSGSVDKKALNPNVGLTKATGSAVAGHVNGAVRKVMTFANVRNVKASPK